MTPREAYSGGLLLVHYLIVTNKRIAVKRVKYGIVSNLMVQGLFRNIYCYSVFRWSVNTLHL
jgi:hypothetical protein